MGNERMGTADGREVEGMRWEGRGRGPQGWFTPPMSEILKNTLIAELI